MIIMTNITIIDTCSSKKLKLLEMNLSNKLKFAHEL